MEPKITNKFEKSENWGVQKNGKKQTAKKSAKVSRLGKMGSHKNYPSGSFFDEIRESRQNGCLGCPGLEKASQRHAEASKRFPKGIQKA